MPLEPWGTPCSGPQSFPRAAVKLTPSASALPTDSGDLSGGCAPFRWVELTVREIRWINSHFIVARHEAEGQGPLRKLGMN